jgi:hypothetical protein
MSTTPSPRGADWRNVAAFVAVTLAVPVLVTALVVLDIAFGPTFLTESMDEETLVVTRIMTAWFPWWMWLSFAPYAAWWVWQGRVHPTTLSVDSGVVTGRTGWPIRRWRSLDLSRLAHVRYHRRFWPQRGVQETHINRYIALRDDTGARIAVTFPHNRGARDDMTYRQLCQALREALQRSPYARASDLTRRRLRGEISGTAFALGVMLNLVLLIVMGAATLVLAGLVLYQVGGLGLD